MTLYLATKRAFLSHFCAQMYLSMIKGLMRTLCGAWIKLCVGRASEAVQSEPAHASAFLGILGASFALLPAPGSMEELRPL